MDLPDERKKEISEFAEIANSTSEEYQLIHATFAIENLQNEARKKLYGNEYESIRKEISEAEKTNKEAIALLLNKAEGLKSRFQNISIQVQYLSKLRYGCARTYRTENGVFFISLPEEMKKVRDKNGKIDFEKMKDLRKLMAHELGHVVLHTDSLGPIQKEISDCEEAEADFFSDVLIDLRKKRNIEIHEDKNYVRF